MFGILDIATAFGAISEATKNDTSDDGAKHKRRKKAGTPRKLSVVAIPSRVDIWARCWVGLAAPFIVSALGIGGGTRQKSKGSMLPVSVGGGNMMRRNGNF